MFKLIYKIAKKLKLSLVIISLATVLSLVVTQTALAATFYNSDKSANCNSGDTLVDSPPYYDSGTKKKFYCVTGLDPSKEGVPATKDKSGKLACPKNIAGVNAGPYGILCLTKLNNPGVISPVSVHDFQGGYTCGGGAQTVHITIDLGCRHKGNAILDALFAIIRFLSIGVGLVIIASIIVAGIQYTTSRGDPQATAKALGRIRETLIGLLIFIFAYAIINWLVPAGLLK